MVQPKTSDKIQQLISEWEAMIGTFVPQPIRPHMAISLNGMREVLADVQTMESEQVKDIQQ